MQKIYVYRSAKKSVAYDNEGWYVDAVKQKNDKDNDDVANFKEYATAEAYKLFSYDISRYVNHFHNIAVLAAAGTSMENGKHGGKTRVELWKSCEREINEISEIFTSNEGVLRDRCNAILASKNLEDFLSFTILYEKLNGEIISEDKRALRHILESKIAEACRLVLDEENRHHQDFIKKLTARKPTEPRVQLYTTNYDTLFEQAAQRMNYTIIDGFSFSYPRLFNGSNFDHDVVYRERTRIKNEESFIPNVIQLFKLHGSIDWEKDGEKIYQKEHAKNPCIIYPASDKYESSYDQPYFEMMSHLQSTLRKEGTLLMVVGFGFQDKHIQNVIKEAVLQNPNFHLLIVCYGTSKPMGNESEEYVNSGITPSLVPEFVSGSGDVSQNVTILFSKFKAFVENYPCNESYEVENINNHETIRL